MEITDTSLKKIVLLIFFLSFLLLLYIDNKAELEYTQLKDISRSELNKQVKVKGTLLSQERYDEHLFLTILQNETLLQVALFYAEKNLTTRKEYTIVGRVSLNKEELQIIASSVKP